MCYAPDNEAVQIAPKSPWRRFFRQPLKPKLSRRVVSNAKINLNRYWNKFEEVTSAALLIPGLLRPEVVDNAINDNLTNESRETDNSRPAENRPMTG